jgi:hypothetical protein
MDASETLEMQERAERQAMAVPFSCPVAPGHDDRRLAAAHELALDVVASSAAAPVIDPIVDAEACAAWLAADFARDRRDVQRPERRGPIRDRRRR